MQIRGRRQTSGWPRVNCSVPGCTRGTTRIEPADGWISVEGSTPPWICGPHWRRVPKHLKRRLRRLESAFKRFHERANRKPAPYAFRQSAADSARKAMKLARINWQRMLAVFDEGRIDIAEIERIIGG